MPTEASRLTIDSKASARATFRLSSSYAGVRRAVAMNGGGGGDGTAMYLFLSECRPRYNVNALAPNVYVRPFRPERGAEEIRKVLIGGT